MTIDTARVPPDTTSNMSMAGFTPVTAPRADAQFRGGGGSSYRQLQLRGRAGLRGVLEPAGGQLRSCIPVAELLGPGEQPFPKYMVRAWARAVEPSLCMAPRDSMSLPEALIVNCTGQGSKTRAGGGEL